MLLATGSALVAGSARAGETQMSTVKVKAVRGFRGVVIGAGFRAVEPGEVVEVAELFARELVNTKKAQHVADAVQPPAPQKNDPADAAGKAARPRVRGDA